MAVVSALCPLSLQTLFDLEGNPVRPARAYFFQAQTQNPLVVYQDALLSVAHQQPVQTTGNGRIPVVFVGTAPYRVRIFDAFGGLVEDIDGIPGAIAPVAGGGGGGTINPGDARLIATGDMVASFSLALRAGFVRCNGYTVGSATSGSTERANADCIDLFKWLWNQDTSHMLPIPGGRGASADGDWAANKQITLPDFRARALFGVDGMGAPITNRMQGAIFDPSGGDATMLGVYGGRAQHVLTQAQLASHLHGASGNSDVAGAHTHNTATTTTGGHSHTYQALSNQSVYGAGSGSGPATPSTVSVSGDGAHNHNGVTDNQGNHQHYLTVNIANAGGDAAHPQTPPFQTATVFIKL